MPAARGKGMEPSLHPLLAAGAAQCLDLFFVALDFPRFRHFVDQAGNEKPEALLLFTHEQLIANLITLLGEICLGRLLVLDHCKNHRSRSVADRSADLSWLHVEGYRSLS